MRAMELIEALYKMCEQYGDLEVLTEGCDCTGKTGRIECWDNTFMIMRGTPQDAELEALEQRQRIERNKAFTEDLRRRFPGMLP